MSTRRRQRQPRWSEASTRSVIAGPVPVQRNERGTRILRLYTQFTHRRRYALACGASGRHNTLTLSKRVVLRSSNPALKVLRTLLVIFVKWRPPMCLGHGVIRTCLSMAVAVFCALLYPGAAQARLGESDGPGEDR